MTVSQLIEELQKIENKDLKVAINASMEEATGMAYAVTIHTSEDVPYDKGDNIYDSGDADEDEQVVFING